jgi:hypothetical protein
MFASFGQIIVARIQRGTKQKGLKMCVHSRFSVCFLVPIRPSTGSSASSTFTPWSPPLPPSARCRHLNTYFQTASPLTFLQGVSLCGRPMRLEFSQVQPSLLATAPPIFSRQKRHASSHAAQAPSAAAVKKLSNLRPSRSSDSLFSEHASATSSTSHHEVSASGRRRGMQPFATHAACSSMTTLRRCPARCRAPCASKKPPTMCACLLHAA